jgi:hypothetical protein
MSLINKLQGLTKKEWEEIHNSGTFGALETLSATDLPGAVIANSCSRFVYCYWRKLSRISRDFFQEN